jgi:hypothetical protein
MLVDALDSTRSRTPRTINLIERRQQSAAKAKFEIMLWIFLDKQQSFFDHVLQDHASLRATAKPTLLFCQEALHRFMILSSPASRSGRSRAGDVGRGSKPGAAEVRR